MRSPAEQGDLVAPPRPSDDGLEGCKVFLDFVECFELDVFATRVVSLPIEIELNAQPKSMLVDCDF